MINVYFGNVLSVFFNRMEEFMGVKSFSEQIFPFELSEYGNEDVKYAVGTRGKFEVFKTSVFSNKILYDKYLFILVNIFFKFFLRKFLNFF